jgi:tetrapyrrole methylase family protein/MazG family protein
LGDALMCIALHARVAERAGAFTLDDLLEGISQKLIRRHSHIFGEDKAATAGEVEALWQANKNKEKPGLPPASALRSVPKTMPALMRAEKVLHRDGTGTDTAACCARAQKLLAELMDAAISSTETRSGTPMDALMGEILFLLAEISDILQINAEISLTNKIEAFINSKD